MFRAVFTAVCLIPALVNAQTISFTFDDGLDPRVQVQAIAWNAELLRALDDARVTAMLFPAGKIVDSPEGLTLVQQWGQRGHAIGNHTYSHRNLGSSKVALNEFTADILAAEMLLRSLPNWAWRLRFPYLKEGDTETKRDGMREWMADHGYLSAPVSIDTSDWYYNERFLTWTKSHPNAPTAAFKALYLAHLWERAQYYDLLAWEVLGRSPSHVMLLHANYLNATFLSDILAMFQAKGWAIVSPLDAFGDPIYSIETTTLPAGESIIWALARQGGYPGLRYPAEDDVYEAPILRAHGF